MSPSILILPDMKACIGFNEPLSMPSQSSADTVMVAPGLSWVPVLTKSLVLPFVQSKLHSPPPSPVMLNW